jgi:hypothetical protein
MPHGGGYFLVVSWNTKGKIHALAGIVGVQEINGSL